MPKPEIFSPIFRTYDSYEFVLSIRTSDLDCTYHFPHFILINRPTAENSDQLTIFRMIPSIHTTCSIGIHQFKLGSEAYLFHQHNSKYTSRIARITNTNHPTNLSKSIKILSSSDVKTY